ncbi:MAG TPA: hypothetical protein VFP60_03510 [Pseudolabrys sp.]|nr:hypothetical protein [Pseudolabrys sp.]
MEVTYPVFPNYVILPACAAGLALVALQLWRLRDVYVAFLLIAMWLRYTFGALHSYTFAPFLFGLSFVALSSICIVAAGIVLIGPRNLMLRKLLPIHLMIIIILISAAYNETWLGALNVTLKWLYLVVFAVTAYIAIDRFGPDRVFRAVTAVFVAPIALQWLSVAWHMGALNEDRTLSYIGGYNHEQAFSIIILTFLYITALSPNLSTTASYLRMAIAAAGLAWANYRTTILAAVVPIASLALAKPLNNLLPRQRSTAFVFLSVLSLAAMLGIAHLAYDRFADLGAAMDRGVSLIQPPEYFTQEEHRLFSGRAYIWSQYIDAYLSGDLFQILFGFGPDSWVGRFALYAHNTFVGQLYELGIAGVGALIWLLGGNMLMAAQVAVNSRLLLLSCHIGFVVLNLATMGLWALEGDILYGLLLGQTWYLLSRAPAANVFHGSSRALLRGAH